MDVFKVGNDLTLDTLNRKVVKNGDNIPLPELSYRLLKVLVENAPNIVTHDQLIEAVWKERVVSDENLKKRVSRLRESLSDTYSEPKYIVAERGMGYRCIAPVAKVMSSEGNNNNDGADSQSTSSNKRSISRLPVVSFLALGLLAIGTILFLIFNLQNESPFNQRNEDLSYKAAQYYFKYTEKDNDTAISLYQDAIDSAPEEASNYSGLADAYLQGYWHYGKNETWLELGKKYAEKAVLLDDNLAWSHKSLGLAYYLSGQFENSIASFNLARQIEPNWGEVSAYTSLAHIQLGHLIEAHKLATSAVELDPGNPLTNASLGELYRQSYRFSAAEEQFKETLNKEPNSLISRLFFSEYLLASGRHIEAISLLREVIKKEQYSQQAHWLMGMALLIDTQTEESINEFAEASRLGGRYSLPAKVYLAALKMDSSKLTDLGEQVAELKFNGNQWAELTFLEGIVLMANNQTERATEKFKLAVTEGFTPTYRFTHLPVSSSVATSNRFNRLLNLIESKNRGKMPKRIPPTT
ncbi:winged helix-turn-helix domain-containing protein [Idiomarina sp. M1R2S28]|uniref:Winged helix-turn-helix domain-containing protein n=1 Tax=Idiomarina rhizosphaerae TaxID=2961572 RepID=A0A9X2FYE2_9GAMM|nr:winged helix-turn-helix transcriptional regulator [Idiomarina rhizosphaerae]MCP1340250.1 winged helix-turn-helix domain-containing protein [Idiomarina rhizosphaerae]